MLDPAEQLSQERRQRQRDNRDCDYSDDGPEYKGVPLPRPELSRQIQRMVARGFHKAAGGERHGCGVKDAACHSDERDDQDDFDLGGCDVETEEKRECKTEDCRAAENGVDADEESGSDAPGELFRRRAHAQECKNRQRRPAVQPAVSDTGEASIGVAAI